MQWAKTLEPFEIMNVTQMCGSLVDREGLGSAASQSLSSQPPVCPLLPNEVVQSRTPVTVPCAALCPLAIQTAHVCIHCTKHREIGHAKLPSRGSYSSWVDNENTPYNSDLTVNKQTKNSE